MRLKWYFFVVVGVFLIGVISTEETNTNNDKVVGERVPFPQLILNPNETDGNTDNKSIKKVINSMDEINSSGSEQDTRDIQDQKLDTVNKPNLASIVLSIPADNIKPVSQTNPFILESHHPETQNQLPHPNRPHINNHNVHASDFDSSEENDDDDDDDDKEDISYSQSGSNESSEENNSNGGGHHINFKPNHNHGHYQPPHSYFENNGNQYHQPQQQYQPYYFSQQYPTHNVAQHTVSHNIKPPHHHEQYISTHYNPSHYPVNHHYTQNYVVKPQSHNSKPLHANDDYSDHTQQPEHHLHQHSHELHPSVLNIEHNDEYNEAPINSPNQNVHIHIGPNNPNKHHSVDPTTIIDPTPVIVTETATVTSTIYPQNHHNHHQSSDPDTTNIQLTNVHVNLPPQLHDYHHHHYDTNGTTSTPPNTTYSPPTHTYHHTRPYYTDHTTKRPYYPDHTSNGPYNKPHFSDHTTHNPIYYTQIYTHKYTTVPTYYRPHTSPKPTHFTEHHHHMESKPQIWCGAYEQYNPCGSECQPTCKNQGKRSCGNKCVSGCFCLPGYARHNGQCIPFKTCPRRKCKKTEVFKECGTTCPLSCDNFHHFKDIKCPSICVPGCFCKDGYVRDNRGKCTLQHKCNRNTVVSKPNKNKYSINNNKFEHDNSYNYNNKYQSSYENFNGYNNNNNNNIYGHDKYQNVYENNNYGNYNNKKNKYKTHNHH